MPNMSNFSLSVILILAVSVSASIGTKVHRLCTNEKTLKFTLEMEQNEKGEWSPTFAELKNVKDPTDKIKLKFEHIAIDCGTSKLHNITASFREENAMDDSKLPEIDELVIENRQIRATGYEGEQKTLQFSKRGGKNVKITRDRKTAYTISVPRLHGTLKSGLPSTKDWGYGAAITSRPLKNNELFEVKLESGYFHIGVTMMPATQIHYTKYMQNQTMGVWTWNVIWKAVYHNEKRVKDNYSEIIPQNGDRLGVMRKSDNSLHFYYNGVDLGTAVHNVGYPVYGFVDLIYPPSKVTIVNERN